MTGGEEAVQRKGARSHRGLESGGGGGGSSGGGACVKKPTRQGLARPGLARLGLAWLSALRIRHLTSIDLFDAVL